MLTSLLVVCVAAAPVPSGFKCPPGHVLKSSESPASVDRGCEKKAPNGQVLTDGPWRSWESGHLRLDAQFHDSRRSETWTYYRPDGTRELIVTFGDEDDTRQLIRDPDQPWRRVEDFGPDHLKSRVNGERVTALGESAHQASRYHSAPVRAVVRVAAIRDALGLQTKEPCCLFEAEKTAKARRESVWRYTLKVVDPALPNVRTVCATLEVRVDFQVEDVLFAAIWPEGEGKADCGGGLFADGFVTALSYRQESVQLASHHLKLLLESH